MRELDLELVEHAARRQAQNPERWQLQHVYGARGELPLDLGATVGPQRADGSPFDVDLVSADDGHPPPPSDGRAAWKICPNWAVFQ